MWYCSGPFFGREAAKEMLTVDSGTRICIELACVRCVVLRNFVLRSGKKGGKSSRKMFLSGKNCEKKSEGIIMVECRG